MKKASFSEISPKKVEKPSLDDTQQLPQTMKTKEGASKNLKDYDCWENDLAP